jgi:fibro-slime domain-containing protein
MVAANLGPSGRPVFTPDGGPVIKGLNDDGEIQWWTSGVTAGGDTVTFSSTGTLINTPFVDGSFFPADGNGTTNANGFLTARFLGSFNLAEATTVTAFIGADDDAFVYVDGVLLAGLGGVHANAQAPVGQRYLGAGEHTVALFYADRYRTQASLNFDLQAAAVPEPATWALMILGFGLVGAAARRRTTRVTA